MREPNVEQVSTDLIVAHLQRAAVTSIDERLPGWARRSNPVVRRHLGIYWKILPPEIDMLGRIFFFQVGLLVLTIPIPFLLELIMPMIAVSIFLLPVAGIFYAQLLLLVSTAAVLHVGNESRNDTLDVLLVTPIPLRDILLSKIAASVWRQMENLSMLVYAVALLSLPLIVMHHAGIWAPDEYPIFSRFTIVLGLGISILRLLLEPLMVGAIGAAVGAAVSGRVAAVVSAAILSFFYFLLINLPRLMPLSTSMRILVEIVLPVAAPILITLAALRIAEYFLTKD